MQSGTEYVETPTKSTEESALGELETRYIAEEITATIVVDGDEYEIDAETTSEQISDIVEQHEDFSSVTVEFACKYCDEKLSIQYSGDIPTHISCECSHCNQNLTLLSKNVGKNTVSLGTLINYTRIYQRRRQSYLKGLQNPDAPAYLMTSISAYGFAICSMVSLGVLIVSATLMVVNILVPIFSIVSLSLGIFLYSFFPKLYFNFNATESSLVLEDFYEGVQEKD